MSLEVWVSISILLANVTINEVLRYFSNCLNSYLFRHLELVKNVTACFLFTLCDLCGTGLQQRGICSPEKNLSRCECLVNPGSNPYKGEFCLPDTTEPPLSSNTPSRWTPIVVGVLAGLAGLFCAVTCCLLAVAAWRRRRRHPEEE